MDLIHLFLAVFLLLVLWFSGRRDAKIESDLKNYLEGLEVAASIAPPDLKVHFSAQVSAVKNIIRKHFSLK